MKELLNHINRWRAEEKSFVVARVIQTWGSSPRPAGSAMVISEDGEIAGSVSGGCVEGAVMKEAKQILENRRGRLLSFGVSDDEAWSVGLTCGGKVEVYLQKFAAEGVQGEVWHKLHQCLRESTSCVLVTELVDGNGMNTLITDEGSIGSDLPKEVVAKAHAACLHRTHEVAVVGDIRYFIHVFPPRSRLLMIGAAHITVDLIQLAKLYDFETIVIDPRGAFAGNMQFAVTPDILFEKYPSEVLPDLKPDACTYAVILSHDPKIDDNALEILLRSKVAYVGALGSRKTHDKRIGRLKQKGFSYEEIARIEAPIGMDINAQGAREIALSIMGSVIKVKNAYL